MSVHELQVALGREMPSRHKNFADVFIATRDYEAVARGLRSLILGGEGPGSSAIFRQLADSGKKPRAPGNDAGFTVALPADPTSRPCFQAEVTSSWNDPVVLGRQWELTFLILAFNALVDGSPGLRRRRLIKNVADAVDSVMERASADLAYEGGLTRVFKAAAEILREAPLYLQGRGTVCAHIGRAEGRPGGKQVEPGRTRSALRFSSLRACTGC